jgi:hypothetical protein
MSKKLPIEPTYTVDEMNEIIMLFATHITQTYLLASRRFGASLPKISPEAIVLVWQREMEQQAVTQ